MAAFVEYSHAFNRERSLAIYRIHLWHELPAKAYARIVQAEQILLLVVPLVEAFSLQPRASDRNHRVLLEQDI